MYWGPASEKFILSFSVNDYCQGILEGDLVDFNSCEADDAQEDEEENENEWYSY